MKTCIGSGTGAGWVFVLLALLFGLAWTWQDIGFYDETIYLAAGANLRLDDFRYGFESGPLYAGWYYLLAGFCSDPVWRYFLSWGLLTGLLLTLPALARVPAAWVYAVLLAGLPVFRIWPYVSLFSAIWLMLGLLWLRRGAASLGRAVALAAVACAITGFSRSEFVYGTLAAVGLFVLLLLGGRTGLPTKHRLVLMAALLIMAAVLGVMLQQSDQSRSGVAFAQHYNLRAAENGLLADESPWLSNHALLVFGVDTGRNAATTQATLGDFVRADPSRVARHALSNLCDPRTVALVTAFLLLAGWARLRGDARQRTAAVYALLISLPALAASVLIYPRYHYAVTCLPVLLLVLIDLAGCARWLPPRHGRWLVPLALIPMLVVAVLPDLRAQRSLPFRPGLVTVRCLQSLSAQHSAGGRYFDSVGFPHAYLQGSWHRQGEQDLSSWSAFTAWIDRDRPDLILEVPGVAARYGQSQEDFATTLAVRGYVAHSCAAPSSVIVHVREEVEP